LFGDIMTGPYALVGARLVERGYAAIPIMPGTKRPGELRRGEWIGKSNWREEYSKRLPSRWEIQVWSNSDAGVGVVCGPASRNLVGVDIDTDDAAIKEAIMAVLPRTMVKKAGAKGETLFFRGTDVLPIEEGGTLSPSWNINGQRVCDFIGAGRQTLLPPTIHPDTKQPYRWTGPDALEDTDPDELPELPADVFKRIGEALAPLGWTPEPKYAPLASGDHGDSDHPYRQVNDWAMANLDAWVPGLNLVRCKRDGNGYKAVAHWRASNRGRLLEHRARNLSIYKTGIQDFGDGPRPYTPINLYAAAAGIDPDDAFVHLSRIKNGAIVVDLRAPEIATLGRLETPPISAPAEPLDKAEELAKLNGWAVDEEAGALSAGVEPLDALTQCPGVVGDIIDWITDTARRPNRVLALGAAVTVVGTLIGRRAATPTRSATHLYAVTLAPTGSGKQHALNCTHRLLTEAGAKHHIGPSEFISMPAVINHLKTKPLSLCAQDEFGAFLKRANGKRASGFESSISKILRMVWGCSFEPYISPEWAGRQAETIHTPALSILGLSTQGEFYASLQGEDVTNGFLNRFLVLSTEYRAPETTPALVPGVVPESLKVKLQELYAWGRAELGESRLNHDTLDPTPDVRPWASQAAQDVYTEFARYIEKRMDQDQNLEPFIARAGEIAVRLATIRAAGRWGHDATVDVSDMEWGRDIVKASIETVTREAAHNMVEEVSHGQLQNKILNFLRKKGGKSVTRRDVMRSLSKAIRNKKDFDATIDVLEESGIINVEKRTPPTGGLPIISYSLG
jgi:Bifunctional DNA primase/polymerase, N-terminal/Protein of unknown function (DUF3987)